MADLEFLDHLDHIREQIQKSLAQSKRQQLRDEFGMQMDYTSSALSPEAENEWLDYILEFERQFANARAITVRERIGNPSIRPAEEIPAEALAEALNDLLDSFLNYLTDAAVRAWATHRELYLPTDNEPAAAWLRALFAARPAVSASPAQMQHFTGSFRAWERALTISLNAANSL